MVRHIAVFTATRAEYGLLKGVMRGILAHPDCELRTIISGAHLSAAHGSTVEEIRADGIPVHEEVNILSGGDGPGAVADAMGRGLGAFAGVLRRQRPDILVVLGDRYETFALAAAATLCRVPLAHIHGGESTEGAFDDAFRHAITKMSHVHFTSCDAYRRRVIQMGEDPTRVFNVGSLGVEAVNKLPLLSEAEIRAHLALDAATPYLLCTFHPVTLEDNTELEQLHALLSALDTFSDHCVIFTGANADPGGSRINEALTAKAAHDNRYRFFMSLGQLRYLSAAKYAACVVGNSSSGIMEIPSLKRPVVDIGDRQKGRIRAESVLHCPPEVQKIAQNITEALKADFGEFAKSVKNLYEKIDTANTILRILSQMPLDNLLKRGFYETPAMASDNQKIRC